MEPGIQCEPCGNPLSDNGFIPLRNMVHRGDDWFIVCNRCDSTQHLGKLNRPKQPATVPIHPRHPPILADGAS